jgi:hypothetical protein
VSVRELKLADFGLETTEQAATRRGQSGAHVRKLVADGLVPAVVIGEGRSARYLVRPEDVDAVPVRARGAQPGSRNAAKEKPEKKGRGKARKK